MIKTLTKIELLLPRRKQTVTKTYSPLDTGVRLQQTESFRCAIKKKGAACGCAGEGAAANERANRLDNLRRRNIFNQADDADAPCVNEFKMPNYVARS